MVARDQGKPDSVNCSRCSPVNGETNGRGEAKRKKCAERGEEPSVCWRVLCGHAKQAAGRLTPLRTEFHSLGRRIE